MGQVWWFATRSAGLMTWVASTASVIVGLLLASRALGRRPTGAWLLDLHRYLGGMTMVFLALHMVTLWADSYVQFGVAELFVPGASAWRTGAVAWGVVAAWLIAAIELSSLIKDRLPKRLWHGIHLGSFAVMAMGTIHAWQAGSDVGNSLVTAVAAVMALAVVVLGGQRLHLRAKAEAAKQERRAALARVRQEAASAPAATGPAADGPPVEAPRRLPIEAPAAPRRPVGVPAPAPASQRPVARPSDRRPAGVDLPPRQVTTAAPSPLPMVARLRPSVPRNVAAPAAADDPGLPLLGPASAPVRRGPRPRSAPRPAPAPRPGGWGPADRPAGHGATPAASDRPGVLPPAGPVRRPPAASGPVPSTSPVTRAPAAPAAGGAGGAPLGPAPARPPAPVPPATRPPASGGGGAAGPRRHGPQGGGLDASQALPSTQRS